MIGDCDECGLSHYDYRMAELIVPDEIWAKIGPTGDESGRLCANCIIGRIHKAGLRDVPCCFASGALKSVTKEEFGQVNPNWDFS